MPPRPMLTQLGFWISLWVPQFFGFVKRFTPQRASPGCTCSAFIDQIATLSSSAGFARWLAANERMNEMKTARLLMIVFLVLVSDLAFGQGTAPTFRFN